MTLGDKNFTEEYILGSLYQQALQAKGYTVTLKGNIGSSEIIYKALQSGQIQGYPEYTGTLLSAIADVTSPPQSAAAAYQETVSYLLESVTAGAALDVVRDLVYVSAALGATADSGDQTKFGFHVQAAPGGRLTGSVSGLPGDDYTPFPAAVSESGDTLACSVTGATTVPAPEQLTAELSRLLAGLCGEDDSGA